MRPDSGCQYVPRRFPEWAGGVGERPPPPLLRSVVWPRPPRPAAPCGVYCLGRSFKGWWRARVMVRDATARAPERGAGAHRSAVSPCLVAVALDASRRCLGRGGPVESIRVRRPSRLDFSRGAGERGASAGVREPLEGERPSPAGGAQPRGCQRVPADLRALHGQGATESVLLRGGDGSVTGDRNCSLRRSSIAVGARTGLAESTWASWVWNSGDKIFLTSPDAHS